MIEPTDQNEQARMIIESAMAELKAIGADHSNAAALLAMQGLCRLGDGDLKALATIRRFADEMLEAYSSSEGETLQ